MVRRLLLSRLGRYHNFNMNVERKQVLAESRGAEEMQAKSVAMEAEVEARKAQIEATAELVVEKFLERIKSKTHSESIFSDVEKLEIKNIVQEALAEFFKNYGMKGRNLIFTLAAIIAALVVIFGGFKTVLGWIGFTYMK